MRFVWPNTDARTVDEGELEELYTYPADRKWLVVNFVSSADGAVQVGGRAAELSNSPDRKVLHLGSDLADVLLVGATTAMVEDFRGVHPDERTARRRRRHGLSDVPPTAVVTTGRTLLPDAPVIAEAETPTIIITCAAAQEDMRKAWMDAGAEVVIAGEAAVDPAAAVRALLRRGLRRIDCEGGPYLFGSLLTAGVVDELRLTVSPLLVSGAAGRVAAGPSIVPSGLELASALAEDDVLLLRYLVHR